jgi:hypothetical protein
VEERDWGENGGWVMEFLGEDIEDWLKSCQERPPMDGVPEKELIRFCPIKIFGFPPRFSRWDRSWTIFSTPHQALKHYTPNKTHPIQELPWTLCYFIFFSVCLTRLPFSFER